MGKMNPYNWKMRMTEAHQPKCKSVEPQRMIKNTQKMKMIGKKINIEEDELEDEVLTDDNIDDDVIVDDAIVYIESENKEDETIVNIESENKEDETRVSGTKTDVNCKSTNESETKPEPMKKCVDCEKIYNENKKDKVKRKCKICKYNEHGCIKAIYEATFEILSSIYLKI